jgi:hypothetical protein
MNKNAIAVVISIFFVFIPIFHKSCHFMEKTYRHSDFEKNNVKIKREIIIKALSQLLKIREGKHKEYKFEIMEMITSIKSSKENQLIEVNKHVLSPLEKKLTEKNSRKNTDLFEAPLLDFKKNLVIFDLITTIEKLCKNDMLLTF